MAIVRRDPFRDIERWEPFGEMESLHRRMNRLFERLMPSGDRFFGLDFMPAAEMDETEDEIHLKLEIPGMEAKDLDIEVSETSIDISGERKSETKTEAKGMVRSEFSYGKSKRKSLYLMREYIEREVQSTSVKRYVLRLASNCTARRNYLPEYSGRGRRPEYGQLVRPLTRQRKGKTLAATEPDFETSFELDGRTIRAQSWHNLVLSDVKVDPERRNFLHLGLF